MFENFPQDLTIIQVSQMLRCSRETVHRNKKLSYTIKKGTKSARVYSKNDVLAYLYRLNPTESEFSANMATL